MNKKCIKLSVITAAAILFMGGQTIVANAETVTEENPLGGMSYHIGQYVEETSNIDSSKMSMLLAKQVEIPNNIAIANVNDYVNVREKPSTSSNIIGILPKDGSAIVLEIADGWAKISSGKVTGYVSLEYLHTGQAGYQKATELAKLTATVTAGSINVRSETSTLTEDNIIAEVNRGEELEVIDDHSMDLLTKDDPKASLWVQVKIDNLEGYVSRDFVTVDYAWKTATKIDPIDSSVSSLRTRIATEAKKHIGLRYVWGGNSLVTGADCSGFVLAVYREVGVSTKSLPRRSRDLAVSGKSVSRSNIKPGDMVFYGNSRGVVDHVALYIGNGKVVHESGYTSGCKLSNVDYRKIIAIRNYLD